MKNIRVILISGLSGSGKTTAIKALEDVGFFCVDNLPILLLPKFIELCEQSGGKILKVAVVEDIRRSASYPSSWDGEGAHADGALSRRRKTTAKDFGNTPERLSRSCRERGIRLKSSSSNAPTPCS